MLRFVIFVCLSVYHIPFVHSILERARKFIFFAAKLLLTLVNGGVILRSKVRGQDHWEQTCKIRVSRMIVCFNLCFLCYLVFRSEFVFCLLFSVCVCCLLPFYWRNKDNHNIIFVKSALSKQQRTP